VSILEQHGRRVFVLEIGGLSTRYVSDSVDISTTNLDANLTTGIAYSNVEGIVEVGAYQASIDPAGGIADYSPVSIMLSSERLRGGLSDPHVIFGRCGPRATDVIKAQVSTDIFHNDATKTITVNQDFTSLSFPRVMHIGAETVRVSSATSTTLTISNRGVGRTPIQTHVSSLGGTNVPEIFTEIVNFRGRKASLFMGQKRPDGSINAMTEIINGFIEESPDVETINAINLSIIPLTALIDNKVSDIALNTTLVQGYHNFDELNGSKLEYIIMTQESEPFRIVGSTGSSTLTYLAADLPIDHSTTFDASLPPADDGNYYIHPRYPELINSDGRLFPQTMTATTLTYDNTDTSYNSLVPSSNATKRVKVRTPRGEVKSYRLTSGVQRFPQIINDVLETNQTGSPLGTLGAFINWKVSDDNSFMMKSLVNKETAESYIFFFTGKRALKYLEFVHELPPLGIWDNNITGIYTTSNMERLFYPFDIWVTPFPTDPIVEQGAVEEPFESASWASFKGGDRKDQSKKNDIRGTALAYYQNGEPTILVKDNLGLPTSPSAGVSFGLEVVYYDRREDREGFQTFPITHQTTATYGGSDIGYLLHIEEPYADSRRSSFGDWSGYEPTKIYLTNRITFQTPGEAILKLLQSGGGSSINGSFDTSSIGLNIDESEIDINSFLQYESIPNIMINLDLRSEGEDFRSVLTPLLQAMGAVLVMRRNENGRCKIALQPIGLEQASSSALTINEADWIADTPPTWSTYEDIVTQIEINFDYDVNEQKLRTKRVFNNQEAINRYNNETNGIKLDLYGVSSSQIGGTGGDSFSFFLPVITRIFNLLSNPLRIWRGLIGTGQSALMDVGRYALVNSPFLKAYGVDYGVTDGVGFIRSIRQELMSEGCEIELIHTGVRSSSWNDSALVTATPSTTTVTIDQDAFSSSNALGVDVKDSDFFKVDDVVDYLPAGDHDNAITGLIISSIVDNGATATITFTTTHGISTLNGTLEPTAYATATAGQQVDAYIANASGVLGTSDNGKEFV
tara:strand:- start:1845 stop:4919 length:3075 start_codon:yes stop_codon:yes gene_type:complete